MTAHDDATLRQIAAARPDRSTWLSANAGSGKTKVLTDRVARLLLDRVDPQHILCLTYTKAAASEMQNRLFKRLGEWAMLDDAALREQLRVLSHDFVITNDTLARARRLFASAVETPGGLKIQTIHSFCSALLRRFPLEAGVTPQFTEMEDRAAKLLRAEVVEDIANGAGADVLYDVMRYYSGETLDELTGELVSNRAAFGMAPDQAMLSSMLGCTPDLSQDWIVSQTFTGTETELLKKLVPALQASGTNDQKAAAKLALLSDVGFEALDILESVFLTGPSAKAPYTAKIGTFPTKACRTANAHLMPGLEGLMARVEQARGWRLALTTLEKTVTLHAFAQIFLPAYENAKLMRGWLDFDDLILRARDLLTDSRVADWVLFKLDGGIDHILVDEAQDTSPMQWQVIEKLAQDFTSGQGTRPDVPRTIFVVGDKKQSIYSFQGADPREFDRMKQDFAARLSNTPTRLQDLTMAHSFRSSAAILNLVDATFQGLGSSGFEPDQSHIAFHMHKPGRVDLWPVVEKPEVKDDPEWFDPVDIRAPQNPGTILAKRIANTIRDLIGTPLPDNTGAVARPILAGDFLILVQRRSDIFHDIIRECKTLGLPVAGADRLKVGAELAVKDIGALLSFLATPEDNLSLATALRSPLFGWSEQGLYDLAQGRKQTYLWAELRDRAVEFPQTMAILDDLRGSADFLRPYELIERILIRHDGRRNLLARLGQEAEDGIDALLAQALAYERNAVDSLTGFLVWMETDDLEIKRQMDSAGDRIRVMTVHGAKGLESPIVILPDTAKRPVRARGQTAAIKGTALWRARSDEATEAQVELDQSRLRAELAERDRLLYVGLTRAEQWLIVAAAGDLGSDGQSWHEKVRKGLERLDAAPQMFDGGEGLRFELGNWSDLPMTSPNIDPRPGVDLPEFFWHPAPEPDTVKPVLSPSDLGGAKALPDERGLDEEAAKRRGRQIHRLLEVLPDAPQANWPDLAARLLSFGVDAATGEELTLLLDEAQKVLNKPSLAHLFAPDALAEVPITADLEALQGHRVHGIIDRLVVSGDHVLAIDFKTNAMVPTLPADCPDGLLRQMGTYAHALAQVYPNARIETALLWTRTATLMHLPHDLVTDALLTTQIP